VGIAGTWAEAVRLRAAASPDGELIRAVGGEPWSAARLLGRAEELATRLTRSAGPGDVIATAAHGPEAVALSTAISLLGAIELPLPEGVDPERVRHLASAAACTTAVVDPARLAAEPHLAHLGTHRAHPVTSLGGEAPGVPRLDDLPAGPLPRPPAADRGAPAAIMLTSGTGGRPRGALLPHGAGLAQADRVVRAMEYDASDVLYNVFPWQHINARHTAFLASVVSGARLVLDDFSARRFWPTVADEEVTAFNFMGALCAILLRSPEGPADRSHRVTRAYGGPAPSWLWAQMQQCFGVELRQAYACTELADVATTGATVRPGAAGEPVPEYDVRIVDEAGAPAGEGGIGRILVRPRERDLTFIEYVGDPDATRAAWADGWFLSGDRGRLVDGWLYHEGRASDAIRRRGLTLDASHIESVAMTHPGVAEAAAVGVGSELTEDEVLLVVVPASGSGLDPALLHRHCTEGLPRHAVPRFISVEPALPHNRSLKTLHTALRSRGLPAGAWYATCSASEGKDE
jgi:carnitine-CoA ligase